MVRKLSFLRLEAGSGRQGSGEIHVLLKLLSIASNEIPLREASVITKITHA